MIIKAWTVREGYDHSVYFSGMNTDNKPIFEPLCCRTRTYKSARAAVAAIRIITSSGYEGAPEEYYADGIEVEDKPVISEPVKIPEPEPQELPLVPAPAESPYENMVCEVLQAPEGWKILDHFGRKLALLHNGVHFAIRRDDKGGSKLYDNATDAARDWCSLRAEVLTARITKLGGAP